MAKHIVCLVALAAVSLATLLSLSADPPLNERRNGNITPAAKHRLEITTASIHFADGAPARLLIQGLNFGNRVAVLKLGEIDLTPHITLWTDSMIEADLLSHRILPATYVVKVYTGVGSVFQDAIDVTIGTVGPEGPPGPPGPTPFVGMSCPEGEVLVGFDASAQLICEPLPPPPASGITVTANANPATIVLGTLPECSILLQQSECGLTRITATVRNEFGMALPGQDVRFSTTAGVLFTGGLSNPMPAANIPIYTDSIGNAVVDLITRTTSTITVTAGNAVATVTVMTTQGTLRYLILNVDNTANSLCSGASTADITSCTQEVCFAAEALDHAGAPVNGLTILFSLQNNTVLGNTFNGTFNPPQVVTGSTGDPGVARTLFLINSDCPQQCSASLAGGPCTAEIVASTVQGIQSIPLPLTINIP